MKKILAINFVLFVSISSFAQVPYTFISNSTISAERVAKFGTIDQPNEFLEITNGTQFDNQFAPYIWAHRQVDNREALMLLTTINSSQDNGNVPMIIFRADVRNNLNTNAPTRHISLGHIHIANN